MARTPNPTATQITTFASPRVFQDDRGKPGREKPVCLPLLEIPERNERFVEPLVMALGRQNVEIRNPKGELRIPYFRFERTNNACGRQAYSTQAAEKQTHTFAQRKLKTVGEPARWQAGIWRERIIGIEGEGGKRYRRPFLFGMCPFRHPLCVPCYG